MEYQYVKELRRSTDKLVMTNRTGKRSTLRHSLGCSLAAQFRLFSVFFLALFISHSAFALTGITYSGRILDSNNAPVTDSQVYFTATIYDHQSRCALYTEQRQLDLSQASGTFSFDIGSNDSSLVGGTAAFNNGITSLGEIFNNGKSFTGLNGCASGPNTYSPSATSPRILGITFKVGALGSSQALPFLTINPVPTAFQAFEIDGYGSGALLRVASGVTQTTNTNSALSQTQYDEFWRVVKNPLTAYLPVTGDVTISGANNKVTTLLTKSLPAAAPTTSGQVLAYDGTNWAYTTLSAGSVTSVGVTAPVTNTGTATAPVIAMPAAASGVSGHLTAADWATFNAKMSSSLASGKVFIGNASNLAEAQTVTGDAAMAADGTLTLTTTITAGAAKGTAQKVPQITYDAKGRLTTVTEVTIDDTTKLPLAGGTMTGAIAMGAQNITNTGNITMAANKYLGLSANTTNGTVAGQMWYDSGVIKYWDGTTAKSLGVAGAGITGINSLTGATQTLVFGSAGTAPVVNSVGSTHTLDIPMASTAAVTAGLLSKTDYDRIGKAESLNGKAFDSTAATTMGQILFYDSVADKLKVSSAVAPTDGQVLKWNNTTKVWEPGTDAGGWTAVDSSYAAKGIVQFNTDAATSGVTVAAGVATVLRTTTGAANTIISTDNFGVAAGYGYSFMGSVAGSTLLKASATTANYSLTLPAAAPTAGQSLQSDASGNFSWVTGAGITSLNGLSGASQTFAIGTAGTAPAFNSAATVHTLDIPMASTAAVTAGLISKTDYDSFTAKQSTSLASAKVLVGNGSNIAAPVDLSGDVTITNAGVATVDKTQAAAASKILQLTASSVAVTKGTDVGGAGAGVASIRYPNTATNTTLTLPGTAGSANQYLQTDGAGNLTWAGVTASLPSLADTKVWVGNGSSVAMPVSLSGDATIDNAGVVTVDKSTTGEAKILALDGSGIGTMYGARLKAPSADPDSVTLAAQSTTDNYTLRFPSAAPAAGQSLRSDGGGLLSWVTALTGVENSAPLTEANIWVGNVSGIAVARPLTGDVVGMNNVGAITIDKTSTGTASKILALDGSGIANAYGVGVKGATSGIATIQAPATFTNYTLTLPVDDGTANQVLKTDGSGVLSWTTPTSTDATKLPLAGGTMTGDIDMGGHFITNISLPSTAIYVGGAGNTATAVYMSGDATISNLGAVTVDKTQAAAASKILQLDANSVANTKGVDVTNTQTTLYATSSASVKVPAGGSSIALNNWSETSSSASYLKLNVYNASSNDQYSYMGTVSTSGGGSWTPAIVFGQSTGSAAYSEAMRIHSNSYVGIGATAPVTKLDVSGVTRSTGFDVNATYGGSQVSLRAPASFTSYTLTLPTDDGTNGDVLTTNGSGVLSWGAASGSLPSLTAAKVWVGNASNVATAVDLSGDVTITNAGVATVDKTTAGVASKILALDASSIATSKGVDLKGTTSGTVSIRPAAAAGTYTLTLPNTAGSSGQVLASNGSGTLSWTTPLTNSLASTKILVGNSSGVAMPVSMSSDATISNTGAVTVDKTTTGQSSKILSLDGSGIGNMFGAGLLGSTSGTITMRAPATTANYTATWPNTAGTAGQVLSTNGSGALSWSNANGSSTVAAKSSNFTVGTSEDNYVYLVSGTTTASLPALASVTAGFTTTIKRIGASNVNILASGSETIDGAVQKSLQSNYQSMTIMSAGSQWIIISGGATTTSSACTPGSQAYNSTGTFTYTISAAQATNCIFTVTVKGGGGGTSSYPAAGGKGGAVQFVYTAPAAGTFEVLVGGGGGPNTAGTSGGGGGSNGTTHSAGGGGGASAVRYTNSTPTNTLLSIAGGGGGGGTETSGTGGNGGASGAGNNGGSNGTERGTAGNNNVGGVTGTGTTAGGAGGSSVGNGTAGTGTGAGAAGAAVAAFSISGGGGGAWNSNSGGGGGGGAGYGGGGAGSAGTVWRGGGGGGGGYINSGAMTSFTDQTTTAGTTADTNGSVLIEWN
jgi:hypothetical protein